MPRITAERRESKRAEIIAAARRCFSRQGFHQTSMPDIAAEAGMSTGAPYRYFASKEEIILEIAGDAFTILFTPALDLDNGASAGDLVAAATSDATLDPAGKPVDESLRCAVQTWSELLRNEQLRERAAEGFEGVRQRIAEALRGGQRAGNVPSAVDPDGGARVVMALLHGFILQRVAFGLDDTASFTRDARALLAGAGLVA